MKSYLSCAFVLALIAGITPVQAQSVSSQLAGCLTIFGAVERLACYDRVARGAAPASANQAAVPPPQYVPPVQAYRPPPASAPATVAMAPPPSSQFGAERVASPSSAAARAATLTAAVLEFRNSLEGKFTVALDNGQAWKQIDGDRLEEMPKSHRVKISHGLFGSYNLAFIGSNLTFKVTRIR